MSGDVFPARTNAAILLMLIATTSSRTCAKHNVGRSNAVIEISSYSLINNCLRPCKLTVSKLFLVNLRII